MGTLFLVMGLISPILANEGKGIEINIEKSSSNTMD